jgi:O-antigen ligase
MLAFMAPVSIVAAQAMAAVVLVLGHLLLWSGARRISMHFGQTILILSFMTILLISSVLSPDFNAAIPQLKKSWVLFCFFPLTVLGWTYSTKLVIRALIWGVVLASIIGIARFLFGGIERAAPFSGGYTTLALFEAAALPLAMTAVGESRRSRLIYAFAIIVMVTGLFLTQTRAGWLAAIVVALIAGYYLNKKATIISLVAALVIAAVLPQSRGIIQKRMASDGQGGFTSGRLYLWSQAKVPLSGLPLFGHGPGSFRRLAPDSLYQKVGDPGIQSWHSTPLDILIESGILALAAIIGAMFIPLAFAWRAFKGQRLLAEGLGLFTAMIALYFAGLTTNIFRDFLLLGMLVVLWSIAFRQVESTPDLQLGR